MIISLFTGGPRVRLLPRGRPVQVSISLPLRHDNEHVVVPDPRSSGEHLPQQLVCEQGEMA